MQPARTAFGGQIVPHTPGTVGSIARQEAGTNPRTKFFVVPAALTARSCQPRIKLTSRGPERLAQPFRRPNPPVLRGEGPADAPDRLTIFKYGWRTTTTITRGTSFILPKIILSDRLTGSRYSVNSECDFGVPVIEAQSIAYT
jgi:hypothetical protein